MFFNQPTRTRKAKTHSANEPTIGHQIMINKNKIILVLSLITLFATVTQASEDQSVQDIKAQITPQQIDRLIQKYRPSMQSGQRNQLSNLVQQHLNHMTPQEQSQIANAKKKDMPDLLKQQISHIPPKEI
jgi:prophage DNA circulation protein